MRNFFSIILILLIFTACSKDKPADTAAGQDYEILSVHPHDTSYFTQGFEFSGDTLVEGTGKNGYSRIIKYSPEEQQIFGQIQLSSSYFGEGVTVLNGKIYQLTWTEGKCFVYDYNTLTQTDTFTYSGEGWGLANNGSDLIMSDGSSSLYFRDPSTFELKNTIQVKTTYGSAVDNLNELEYAEGQIWANIWGDDHMISIDPVSGTVTGRYDLSELRQQALDENPLSDVLNGIAYRDGSFFVTGKYWPGIYRIKLTDR